MASLCFSRLRHAAYPFLFGLAIAVTLSCSAPVAAQGKPDPAVMLLESGQKAYNDKNYTLAANQLREFLKKFGGHKDANLARFSLALALIHGPEKNYQEAVQNLQPLSGQKDSKDYPQVMYYLGLARRGQGVQELAQAAAKPQEAAQRKESAKQHFTQASQDLAAALAAFQERAKKEEDPKKVALEQDWAARARCDLAEMFLRTGKLDEARKTTAPFVKEVPWSKSKYQPTGLYYHGFACFLLNDYLEAGRSLSSPAVLNHPVHGTHARYLLARVHHLQDERAEAADQYEGVLADFAKQKKAAQETLKNPALFKNDPEEKSRLEALANGPPPDHVARSQFYLAVLQYENGQFAEAQTRLTDFLKQFPTSPLVGPAQLRLGFTHVQLKQFPDAQKTLSPLAQHPQVGDQALLWLAKAQVGAADPANAPAYNQALANAINTLNQAANKANELAQKDPLAKARRGEILMELVDTMILAKQYKEAANICLQVRNEKLLPAREEEVMQRQATALHLAGDFIASDQICQQFQKAFPKSTLLPAILFRHAENIYFMALAYEKTNAPNKAQDLAKLNDEIIKRYTAVIEQFPEFAHINLARFGAAMGHYRKGELEKTIKLLDAIPAPDRQGQLGLVPFVLADCQMRLTPANADDALAAGIVLEKTKSAIELLESFTGAQPKGAETPDALLKLGLCYQKLAKVMADPQEKTKALNSARATYEKLAKDFPQDPLVPQSRMEQAKCLALTGNVNGAIEELKKFAAEPMQKTSVAPMALLELATLYRGQKKFKEATEVLAAARQQHEGTLQNDPVRAGWVDLLRYHHGLALQEFGKLPEARAAFDAVVKKSPGTAVAVQAALGYGQCLRQEGIQLLDEVKKKIAVPNLPLQQIEDAKKLRDQGLQKLKEAAQYLEDRGNEFKQKNPGEKKELARMYYEAAWSWRGIAEFEIATVRAKMEDEAKKKMEDVIAKKTPPGKTPPPVVTPPIPTKAIPMQPAEQKARANYQILVKDFNDVPLANNARLELAELLANREEWDPAIQILADAFENELPELLGDEIRLRLGMCQLFKGNAKEGLKQLQLVADNAKSPLAAQGTYYTGEAMMHLKDWDGAIKYLAKFRDFAPFQNVPGVTDRGLLRLGHAYAQQQKWNESKQAHEQVWGRFPNSTWVSEAKYGAGWAWQNQKQFDQAVSLYEQVVANTLEEIAAKSQLQIGLCRREQKRFPEAAAALLVVPYCYDYPEWSGAALFEAHRVFLEMKNHQQAVLLLQRIVSDYPTSPWAKLAQEELTKLKEMKAAAAGN